MERALARVSCAIELVMWFHRELWCLIGLIGKCCECFEPNSLALESRASCQRDIVVCRL